MAESFGLTTQGFKAKEFAAIKSELEANLKANVDPTLRFDLDTVAGVITAIVSNQARQVWESLGGLYHSLQPDTAAGRALDALCSLTGTYRKQAEFSKAKVTLTLDAKAKVPVGTRLQGVTGHFFKVTKEVVNRGAAKVDVYTDVIAETVGPIIAHQNTEAKIMTPVVGLSKAVFKSTNSVGRFNESDDELRLRRIIELKATGSSTVDAIRSRLQQLPQVESVHVEEYSKSFGAVVKGGNDQDIAMTLWQSKPLGVKTWGTTKCKIKDSIGCEREICFSRPTEIPLTLHVNLKVRRQLNEQELTALKTALVDSSKKHFSLGAEVYPSRFFATLLSEPIVLDVMTLQLRERASGDAARAVIKPEEIATLEFKDIHFEQIVESVS